MKHRPAAAERGSVLRAQGLWPKVQGNNPQEYDASRPALPHTHVRAGVTLLNTRSMSDHVFILPDQAVSLLQAASAIMNRRSSNPILLNPRKAAHPGWRC